MARLPWIQLGAAFDLAPRLKGLLGTSHLEALGLLAQLERVAVELVDADGRPYGLFPGERGHLQLAGAVGWPGDADGLVQALAEVGKVEVGPAGVRVLGLDWAVKSISRLEGWTERRLHERLECGDMERSDEPRVRLKTPAERAEAEEKALERQRQCEQELSRVRAQRQAERGDQRARGRVYFCQQSGGDELVKIGWTRRDPQVRVKELQAGHASWLVLLASAPGGLRAEKEIQRKFAALNVGGEWFRPGPELLIYVAAVAQEGQLR